MHSHDLATIYNIIATVLDVTDNSIVLQVATVAHGTTYKAESGAVRESISIRQYKRILCGPNIYPGGQLCSDTIIYNYFVY